eukprot:Seg1194.8 transcript_id=Seg1194.8/GoldUCD/mRNA.D3Y31 product="hypothetical protein" protein_id=Seg1194.8/GoldUCD/D3Y31
MFNYTDALSQKRVAEWGITEVGIWLDSVGCGEYREIFRQHDIRGPELIALEKADLHVSTFCKVKLFISVRLVDELNNS